MILMPYRVVSLELQPPGRQQTNHCFGVLNGKMTKTSTGSWQNDPLARLNSTSFTSGICLKMLAGDL
jgi:hypothetical protein